MKLREIVKIIAREHLSEQEDMNLGNKIVAYHGTNSLLPFQKFESSMIGTGTVSQGTEYNGFFFTTEKENAEYYAEYFICKVVIDDVKPSPIEKSNPSSILNLALKNTENYIIKDVLVGIVYSDIIVVPKNNLNTIKILEWEYIGDEEDIFEKWDEAFGFEDGYIDTDIIKDTLEMMDMDLEFLVKIPIFKKYYDGKR
jgi:hypothetical protein